MKSVYDVLKCIRTMGLVKTGGLLHALNGLRFLGMGQWVPVHLSSLGPIGSLLTYVGSKGGSWMLSHSEMSFCIRLLKAEKLAEFKHRPTEFARIALLFLTNGFVPTLSRLRCIWFVNLQTHPMGQGFWFSLPI